MERNFEAEIGTGLLLLIFIIALCIDVELSLALSLVFIVGMVGGFFQYLLFREFCHACKFSIGALFVAIAIVASLQGYPIGIKELLMTFMIISGSLLPWTVSEAWFKT